MQMKRDRVLKIVVCVAAVFPIAAGPPAHAGEKIRGALTFRRADLKRGPVSPPPVSPVFSARTVVSPDGNYQATSAKDGRIRYSRISDGKVERIFYACEPMVLEFSLDGSFLASAGTCHSWGEGKELTVKLWPLATREGPIEIKVPGTRAEAIAGSRDRVVISSETGIYCYLRPSGTLEWSDSKPAGICELKFADDGQSVLASFLDGSFKTYDLQARDTAEVDHPRQKPR